MSLKNKNILVTRDIEQSQEFVDLIKHFGGNAIIFPTIEIQKPDTWEELDNLLLSIDTFDGLIFTSQNAVKIFFERLKNIFKENLNLEKLLIFAVGEKTKIEIEKQNLRCTGIPESFDAENLAELMINHNISNKRFLFPRGNISREVLIEKVQKLGGTIYPIVVYNTVCPEPANTEEIANKLLNQNIDVVTFTSPSTALNFFKIFSKWEIKNRINTLTKIAVIGNTTAAALLKINIKPDIIANPSTIEGLLKSIIKYFGSNQSNTASTD